MNKEKKPVLKKTDTETNDLASLIKGISYAGMGINIISEDYKILYQNDFLKEKFGDLTGKLCYENYLGIHKPCSSCPVRDTIKDKKVHKIEIAGLNGRLYELISSPIIDEDGSIDKVMEIVNDITERKSIEEMLKQSEEKYRMIFESANDVIIFLDKKGTIIDVNKRVKDFYGYDREELIGRNIRNLAKFMTKKNQAIVLGNFLKRIAGIKVSPYVVDMVTKDKRKINIEINAVAVKKNGKIIGDMAVLRDVTERKRMEELLKQSEKKFRDAFDYAAIGRAMADASTKLFLEANNTFCNMLGYSKKELLNKKFIDLVHPEGVTKELVLINKLLAGKIKHYTIEERVRHKRGHYIIIQLSVMLERDAAGKPQYFVADIIDITERKQAEEQAKKERDLAQKYLDTAGVMFIAIDRSGTVTMANKKAAEILGYGEDEIVGKDWFESFLPQEEKEEAKQVFNKLISGGIEPVEYYENQVVTRDGQKRLIFWHNALLEDSSGNITGTLSSGEDITEKKQIDDALMLTQYSVDKAADMVIWLDIDGTIIYTNYTACSKLGYSRKELQSMKINEIDVGIGEKEWHERVKKLQTETHGTILTDYCTKKGEVFPVEVITTYLGYKDKKYIFTAAHDITERKKYEQELRDSEEKHRIMFNSINDAVFVHRPRPGNMLGKLIEVNDTACKMLGYQKDEMVGKLSLIDFTKREASGATSTKEVVKTISAKGTSVTEKVFLSKDGKEIPVEISSRMFQFREKPTIITIVRDITERKRMQEQLMVTDRLASIGELAAGVAHEMNNPLTGVIGFSQLLLEKEIPDDIKEDIAIINHEAQRTAEVVRNLLTFARKHVNIKQPVNINSVIANVLRLRAYEQKVSNIKAITRLSPDLPEVMANSFQLQQVFLNIVLNAEHFMTESHGKGNLTITTEPVGGNVKISFSDDGPGIKKKDLRRIFDPFFTTKDVGKGTGLGLSICHGVITEHGGKLYVESEYGKGATFIIELPGIKKNKSEG